MLNRVKTLLGIEGVRLALAIDKPFALERGVIRGVLTYASLRPQRVEHTALWLEETYARGRGGDKLVSKLELGRLESDEPIALGAREEVSVPFELRFAERRTRIEQHAESAWLKPLVYLAKKSAGAKSVYVLHARAEVAGVRLSPQAKLLL